MKEVRLHGEKVNRKPLKIENVNSMKASLTKITWSPEYGLRSKNIEVERAAEILLCSNKPL